MKEIKVQLLAIASEKNIHYLNYVKERFIVEILNKISIPTIDKWAETTHLNTSDFPFLNILLLLSNPFRSAFCSSKGR